MASTPTIGPQSLRKVTERYYPRIPVGKPVMPEHVNQALRTLSDQVSDAQTAFTALAQKLQTNSAATGSISASSSVQVKVPIPSPFPDIKYTATAGVVGTKLSIGDVVKSTGSVLVTVINLDAGGAHSGTVSIIVLHQ